MVKEKFGGLRVDVNGTDMETLDLMERIEKESTKICEVCGNPGKLTKNQWGWEKTLCKKHKGRRS